jgi:hypothetical protein
VGDRLVARRAPQGVHRLLDAAVEFPAFGVVDLFHQIALLAQKGVEVGVGLAHCFGHLLEARQPAADLGYRRLDVLTDRLRLIQGRFLLQQPD